MGRAKAALRLPAVLNLNPTTEIGVPEDQWQRQSGVQAEVTFRMHVAELAPDQERLGRPTRGTAVQSEGTGTLHRDRGWLSEHGSPGQRVGKN